MNKWIDLTEDLSPEGVEKVEVGQVLMFTKDGVENNLKIMRKRNGKVWVKHVAMYLPDQVKVVSNRLPGEKIDKQ